mmetsp:Transcript_28658/g.77143  ORF Transcript_28658/g.77143 Transcript_28658/m.77143 type:complete len:212 (+) Transcript_28658:458-1093(+)
MKRMIWPSAFFTSVSTAFNRSSNSPRNLAPAMSAPMSSAMSFFPLRASGTSPDTIRCAMPSAMAVLPTPGSPSRMGLFLVRRLRIWIARRISSSRPITGSSLPSAAARVRSAPYLSRASKTDSADWLSTFCPLRRSVSAASRLAIETSCFWIELAVKRVSSFASAITRWSTAMNESPIRVFRKPASLITFCSVAPMFLFATGEPTLGRSAM